jgi:hypothetical protein
MDDTSRSVASAPARVLEHIQPGVRGLGIHRQLREHHQARAGGGEQQAVFAAAPGDAIGLARVLGLRGDGQTDERRSSIALRRGGF